MTINFLITFSVAIFLGWILLPTESTKNGHRWGRYLSAITVMVITVANLWRFASPAPAGGINALAIWILQLVFGGISGYVVGLAIYYLVQGVKMFSKNAIPTTKQVAQSSYHQLKKISIDSTRNCPYCAESIKSEAIVCRYCNRDIPRLTQEAISVDLNSKPKPEPKITQSKPLENQETTYKKDIRRGFSWAAKTEIFVAAILIVMIVLRLIQTAL